MEGNGETGRLLDDNSRAAPTGGRTVIGLMHVCCIHRAEEIPVSAGMADI